jgi:hypothetical protein
VKEKIEDEEGVKGMQIIARGCRNVIKLINM